MFANVFKNIQTNIICSLLVLFTLYSLGVYADFGFSSDKASMGRDKALKAFGSSSSVTQQETSESETSEETSGMSISGKSGRGGGGGGRGRGRGRSGGGGGGGRYSHTNPSTSVLDTLCAGVMPVGDREMGLPDTYFKMGAYCVGIVARGLPGLAIAHVRWPHKFLLKALMYIWVIGALKTNAEYCLNPLTMNDFVSKAKIVNEVEEIYDMVEKFRKRAIVMSDRIKDYDTLHKVSCCQYWEFRRSFIELSPPSVQEFLGHMMYGYFNLPIMVFCATIPEGHEICTKQVNNEDYDGEGSTTAHRSILMSCIQVVSQFI